jgi:hypothetical protein
MKKAGLLAAGTIPGLILGYAVLVGFLMKRIAPVPIVTMPDKTQPIATRTRARQARQPSLA